VGRLHNLGAVGDEFPECFWEREIPAYQHAYFPDGRVEDFVHVAATSSEVVALGAPCVGQ
jgi:hypothetical protein